MEGREWTMRGPGEAQGSVGKGKGGEDGEGPVGWEGRNVWV